MFVNSQELFGLPPIQCVETKVMIKPKDSEQTGAQLLSGRVLDSRRKGHGFEPHRRHCVMSLSKNINPSLVLVQPRKTCPFITERLLMGRKETNNKQTNTDQTKASISYLVIQIFHLLGKIMLEE